MPGIIRSSTTRGRMEPRGRLEAAAPARARDRGEAELRERRGHQPERAGSSSTTRMPPRRSGARRRARATRAASSPSSGFAQHVVDREAGDQPRVGDDRHDDHRRRARCGPRAQRREHLEAGHVGQQQIERDRVERRARDSARSPRRRSRRSRPRSPRCASASTTSWRDRARRPRRRARCARRSRAARTVGVRSVARARRCAWRGSDRVERAALAERRCARRPRRPAPRRAAWSARGRARCPGGACAAPASSCWNSTNSRPRSLGRDADAGVLDLEPERGRRPRAARAR